MLARQNRKQATIFSWNTKKYRQEYKCNLSAENTLKSITWTWFWDRRKRNICLEHVLLVQFSCGFTESVVYWSWCYFDRSVLNGEALGFVFVVAEKPIDQIQKIPVLVTGKYKIKIEILPSNSACALHANCFPYIGWFCFDSDLLYYSDVYSLVYHYYPIQTI